MTTFPAGRAFLVMVSEDSDVGPGRFRGRVEHIASGRRARFSSHNELYEHVTGFLLLDEDRCGQSESKPTRTS